MRVGQSGNNPVQGGEASAAKQSGRGAPAQETKRTERASTSDVEKTSNRGGARAEISAKSKEFAQAKAAATGAPDVRDERIAELKKRLSEGTYKVDADAVSDRMVDEHLRMSGIG